MADDLWQRSAVELADGIRQKAFSCREVMGSVVGRIRAMNPTLNAIVYDYTDDALAEARRADDELAAGRARGAPPRAPPPLKEKVAPRSKPPPHAGPPRAKGVPPAT